MTEPATEPDLFEGFDSSASILVFVHHVHGEQGLRQVLATVIAEGADGDYLERQSTELERVGLIRAAELVRQHAANILGAGLECPFQEGTTRCRDWMRRNRRIFKEYQLTEDSAE